MKVQASPFEPPVEMAALEASDRARLERLQQAEEAALPIAPMPSIQTELNPATRQSLSKLAVLIRSQMRANEAAVEEAEEESKEKAKLSIVKGTGRETELSLADEGVRPEAFPTVVRANQVLREAERQRGFGVYGQQRSNALVELVVKELAAKAETTEEPTERLTELSGKSAA